MKEGKREGGREESLPPLLLLLHVVDDESDNGGGDDGDHDNFLDRCIPSFLPSFDPPRPVRVRPRPSDISRAAEMLAMRGS